ncbi:MAG TPA: hypothetical protein VED66_00315 [Candidatus Sulfotelmatobacter sp.]|nr:hypothetical protein [Candidatus Sulfotelmatobacter sp.]
MKIPRAKLGYTGAGLTVFAAVLAPFVLYGMFTKGFASLGLHVDEMYSGGPKVRTVQCAGYTIDIHRQVSPHFFQTEKPFVQLDWKPADALPPHVSEAVDIDGDGKPDVRVSFDVPKDPKAPLRVNVDSLNPHYEAMRNVGKPKYSSLIVRVDNSILVRVPVVQ